MTASVFVLGVRHHGPGSARMVRAALDKALPDAVLIEGPPDAADVLALAADAGMKPPVALLVYEPDRPSKSVYYPFAEFSPEWQALRWALTHNKEVRFIDLPQSLRVESEDVGDTEPEESLGEAKPDAATPASPRDVLEELALAAGFRDGEAWWGRFIEERRGDEDAIGLFDAIRDTMGTARAKLSSTRGDVNEPAREAHMRREIRAAMKAGFEHIAVVCGAWHAPVLTVEALKEIPAKSDLEILKGLSKRKTAATWIPWTYDRLSMASGYGAGISSPGWYEHLWAHRDRLSERWLTRVARFMRDEDLDASPANVIESVRLADSLAALRGRSIAGLDELCEAALSILCHGNPLPMRVIERKLIIGNRLGEIPDVAPTVPLQRDLAALQKSLRLKVSADDVILDLDQRKENDLSRSRLLHRLVVLRIDWGVLQADQRQRTSTFHEIWKLQWRPELAVAVIEAARWGNTVHDAAVACVADRAASATSLSALTEMLDHVMLADLSAAVEQLVLRIHELSAVAAEIGNLMDALPPLARVLRYGNVRKTDADLVEPLMQGLLARICVGLLPACASLDDDAATAMRNRIDGVHTALITLARTELLELWGAELRRIGDADLHGLVGGRVWRLLLDSAFAESDEASSRLSLALSRGNDPAKASAWLEGFLGGSGMLLIHDDRLLAIIDEWVTSLTQESFEQVCPIARRTFSTFEKPERRTIGERIRRGDVLERQSSHAPADDYDPMRGALMEHVLRLILGDPLP
jgi:hypothetical protein